MEVIAGILFVLLTGMIANNQVQDRIILIPDADGKVGEIVVSNDSGVSHTINTAYTAIESRLNKSLSTPENLSEQRVKDSFADALTALPQPASRYILYFISGTSDLTEASRQMLPDIIAEISKRDIYDIYIDGHTDTRGSDEQNYQLALSRAHTVFKLLSAQLPQPEKVVVRSHGEGNPLIKTADNIDESQNRRVEILIH